MLAIDPTVLTAVGAFLAGVGSLLGGIAAIVLARRRGRDETKAR